MKIVQLSDQEKKALLESKWRQDHAHWRSCRVCHRSGATLTWGWSSPKYSFYHAGCVAKSSIAKKAIRKFAKADKQVSA